MAVYYGQDALVLNQSGNSCYFPSLGLQWVKKPRHALPVLAAAEYKRATGDISQDKRQQNNEGMLAMPVIRALAQGDAVQLWRGGWWRALLAET